MYGLMNKAIEDMVCMRFGSVTWEVIKQKAGADIDVFISMDAYPDALTYRLVEAASTVLHLPTGEILQASGEHWMLYTGQEGYGKIIRMTGHTLPAFLQNLDNLYSRIRMGFPHLIPPRIHCTDVQEDSLHLHYHSARTGLAPLVIGLLKGLGTVFNMELDIAHIRQKDQGADHDEFLVRFKER